MPWLSPASDPKGEYFGAFAEVTFARLTRDIEGIANPSGNVLAFTLGLDYTLLRSRTWLLQVQAGGQYTTYGGITDTTDGFSGLAGMTVGLRVSRSISLTLSPEMTFVAEGNWMLMIGIGAQIEF